MLWEENVRIETPEQIDVDLEVAGPGSRFLAQAVDWCIEIVIMAVIGLTAMIVVSLAGGPRVAESNLFLGCMIFLLALVYIGYDVYYEGFHNGQTPGKRWAGIRVVRDGGGPIDVTAACIRNIVGLADILPFFYLLGAIVMLLNNKAQRLGDMAAGTIVIREVRDEPPDEVEEDIKAFAAPDTMFDREHLERCEATDVHVLYSFFARRSTMERRERNKLADKLCDIFLQKTGYPDSSNLDHPDDVRTFLASLYRELKAYRKNT